VSERPVALITGAAHGQGRAASLALAEDGYDVVALDVAAPLAYPGYEMGTPSELESLRAEIEAAGGACLPVVADVREDRAGVRRRRRGDRSLRAHRRALQQRRDLRLRPRPRDDRGRVGRDARHQPQGRLDRRPPRDPAHDRRQARGDREQLLDRRPARHGPAVALRGEQVGLTGLTKSWAIELAPHGIRVVSLHPTGVDTPLNDGLAAMEGATPIEIAERSAGNLLPVPWIEPRDVAEALRFLVSDRARYMTGTAFVIDAGLLTR
jgi:NAD(P)-dependent dehydrogenase (short-subunit alcohol dehydrogenase family)